ncbi:MAG TPA: lipopolysaccharide biosynthesis protein [Xanthomonadaceae bacterium]|nr:lipopolysaccharide biosynthesis protein [Xanthomonadaceae bacterium]
MPLWAWGFLHFAVALGATWLLRRYALHRRLVDLPGERRSHTVATPRGGGMAIVLAMLAGLAWLQLQLPAWRLPILGFMAGLSAVAAVGWWDDHRPLSARLRLLVHALASLWLGWLIWDCTHRIDIAIGAAAMAVVLVNVWNFMDGINGLATTQALIAATGYALVLPATAALPAWALAAACLGFLPFNFPRARIFLGDGGSGALGYLLAGLLGLAWASGGRSPWLLLLPPSAFLVDAGFTLAARMLSRQRWWEPHAQHVYQALSRKWRGHAQVTLAYACFSAVAVVLFLWLQDALPRWGAIVSVCWLVAASALWLSLRKGLRAH